VDDAYRLVMAVPPVDDYLTLRRETRLSPRTREQALAALPGGWAACHAVHQSTGEIVDMGRLSVMAAGTSTSSTWLYCRSTSGAGWETRC
jgi:hypothetical protein